MGNQNLQALDAERKNPFTDFAHQDAPSIDVIPQVRAALSNAQTRVLGETEVLTFLAEILDGGGDSLSLSPDARAGLSTILGAVSAVMDSIAGEVDRARGMLPDTEPAQ